METAAAAASRATGASRESKGEFLLFIYELFIRLVELSLSHLPLLSRPFSPPFSLSLFRPLDASASSNPYSRLERVRQRKKENGKKGGKYAWRGTPSPERVPEISRLPGAEKKCDIFPRS